MTFSEDGYQVVDGLISPADLIDFQSTLRRLEQHKSDGELYDTIAMLPEFLRIAFGKWLVEYVNTLMDRPPRAPIYGYMNRCLIQPPNDERRTYGWHQDVFYTIPNGRFIQVWAPLVYDSTPERGTIEVCPGSHLNGIAPQRWIEPGDRNLQILVDDAEVAKYEPRAISLKLGQVLLFDAHLFHRSGRNTSAVTRYTLVGRYHAADAHGFRVPVPEYRYRGLTPKQYHAEMMATVRR